MAELLAVLGVIGVLAAAASPTLVRVMSDKRVSSGGDHIAELYRTARSRSMGRGSAVVVRWNSAQPPPTDVSPAGHFTVREAIQGTADDFRLQPVSRCLGTDWRDAATTSHFIAAFDERWRQYQPSVARFIDQDGNAQDYAEICYSPRGRTFIRYDAGAAFVPLNGVPRVELTNTRTSYVRHVVVPPNGAARVVTRVGL